jgi:hypothetical protein
MHTTAINPSYLPQNTGSRRWVPYFEKSTKCGDTHVAAVVKTSLGLSSYQIKKQKFGLRRKPKNQHNEQARGPHHIYFTCFCLLLGSKKTPKKR